jgi:hypothetical protein
MKLLDFGFDASHNQWSFMKVACILKFRVYSCGGTNGITGAKQKL